MISVHFQGKPLNITLIQVYAPNTKAKEAEFEWVYEDLLRVPSTARRSNQSILKEISPGCSLEKTLILGGIGGRRRRGPQKMRWLDGISDSMTWVWWTLGVGDGHGDLACCNHGVTESWTRLSDWTELNWTLGRGYSFYPLLMSMSEAFSISFIL